MFIKLHFNLLFMILKKKFSAQLLSILEIEINVK